MMGAIDFDYNWFAFSTCCFSWSTSFPLSLLPIPEGVQSVLTTGIGYLMNGFEIIAAYTHFSYLLSLFTFVMGLEVALLGYKVVMWIIRKIPFFNVS